MTLSEPTLFPEDRVLCPTTLCQCKTPLSLPPTSLSRVKPTKKKKKGYCNHHCSQLSPHIPTSDYLFTLSRRYLLPCLFSSLLSFLGIHDDGQVFWLLPTRRDITGVQQVVYWDHTTVKQFRVTHFLRREVPRPSSMSTTYSLYRLKIEDLIWSFVLHVRRAHTTGLYPP